VKIPRGLQPLIDDGVIDEVVRPLKSGKEASVWLVASKGTLRCAKVYKEANQRGFQKMAQYQEGRSARGSRDQRARNNRSRHGRREQEIAWKNAEVDALYKLAAAGVRVPAPHGYIDGVLLMELVIGDDGLPAPRLNEITLSPEMAREYHAFLIRQIVRMLCAGLIHGDLSEYNVLLDTAGPVIIDLPQAVDASAHNSAFAMLARDIGNMNAYFGQFAPELLETAYPREIWKLYQHAELHPDSPLTGICPPDETTADIDDVMLHIEEARREAEIRQQGREAAEAEDNG